MWERDHSIPVWNWCELNPWYVVDCNSSTPYLPALNHLQLLSVNLENQTAVVSTPTPRIYDCQSAVRNSSLTMSIDLSMSPFLFCKCHNIFVFDGCGNAVMMDNGSTLTGCSTFCANNTISERNKCFGFGCCQTTIPHYLKSHGVDIMDMERQSEDGSCGYAFLVDKYSYVTGSVSLSANNAYVPVSLMWTLPHNTALSCCRGAADPINLELNTGNGTSMESWRCSRHFGYKGNPYLVDGCEVIEDCASCPYSSCNYDILYDGDGTTTKVRNFTCGPYNQFPGSWGRKSSTGVILGNAYSISMLVIMCM